MKIWTPPALAVGLVAMTIAATNFCVSDRPDTRSVGPVTLAGALEPPKFSRDESTGLFVGVRSFTHDKNLNVPYAVDDAVDLAYRFSLDQRVSLVPPRRVVLALSGLPQKEESKRKLDELRDAGAKVTGATSGDIAHWLKRQASLAGREGLLVLSLATHGFLQKGDAYILGSTSTFGSPYTAVRTATLLDIAARAGRSLVFIDACRDRIGQTSRSSAPDPAAAAPVISRMARVHGQVIFYAAAPGRYAYDDHVHRNGVFTKAVLDGLSCLASAPRGTVVAETLHTFIEREVRRWIQENHNLSIAPATQVSMEGVTRNMPLSECWRSPGPAMEVKVDGSRITAYDDATRPLFRKDFGQPILQAEVADLDADARREVVVAVSDKIIVLDRDGSTRWTKSNEAMSLGSFTTGDLFRKHTSQVVAIWLDEGSASRLTVFDGGGKEISSCDYAARLQRVAIGRPTNMHDPKIAVTTAGALVLFDPKKLAGGKPLWHCALVSRADTIRNLRILDADHDSRRDIVVDTTKGMTLFDFGGRIIRQTRDETTDAKSQWKSVGERRRKNLSP